MSKKLYGFLISILTLLPTLCMSAGSIQASSALNVGLTRFEAIPLDNAVRLEWDTETELGTAGFMLTRGQNGSFDYLPDPGGAGDLFIGSEGDPTLGYDYTYTDETAVNGETYTYQLVEIEIDGSKIIQANTSVTVGIVPTNTPIILGTGGGNGSGNNPTDATATATIFPSPTPPTNNTPEPSATPFPTLAPTVTALAIVTRNSTAPTAGVADKVAPDINAEAQSIPGRPLVETNSEPSQTGDSGFAIAFAQEDPANYPEPDPLEGESPDAAVDDSSNDLEARIKTGEHPDRPEVIGTNQYPADDGPSDSDSEVQNTETAVPTGGMAGKIYLWVAFVAAVIIFTAAVLGAILLYTRQRYKE